MTELPTIYSQFIHQSRYSRWIESENRRETWEETAARYFDFFTNHLEHNYNYELTASLRDELEKAVLNLEIMPSMRALMTAGPALERCNVGGFNCSYLPIDSPRAFDEMMYILMSGTGVGFSVERQYVQQLPVVNEHFENSSSTLVVEDSKSGWAKAYRELISMLYVGQVPQWDLSKLRPAGARLKTFGGRSSGPAPLNELFQFTVSKFKNAAGRKLTSLECHDIACKIGEIVVVGGVRRSALISLSNLSDNRMREAKAGAWWEENGQRALANNSVCYTEKPEIGSFMDEWVALYKSKSGERGIFNRQASERVAAKNGRRELGHDWGTNPCSEIVLRPYQFCVAPDTKLITKQGIHSIKSIKDREVDIWNGEEWTPVKIRKTGENQRLMRVTLSDGSYLDCTPDHRWSVKDRFKSSWCEVQTKDLMNFSNYSLQIEPANVDSFVSERELKHAYTLGFAAGDGCVYDNAVIIDLYGNKISLPIDGIRGAETLKEGYNVPCVRVTNYDIFTTDLLALKSSVAAIYSLSSFSKESFIEFLAGWLDADGSETGTGGVRLYLSNEERARALQLVLTRFGIRSSVNLMQEKGAVTNLGMRQDDMWYLQITECQDIPCIRLNTSNGHAPKFKGKYQNIVSVKELSGLHDTYCFNEPKKHKGLFNNVLTYQCNLTEVVVRAEDTQADLERKVRLATILGTFQSTLTNFKYLRKIWANNTEEECLLGVSLTGIMDHKWLANPSYAIFDGEFKHEDLELVLEDMRQVAVNTNKEFADILGVNQSTAITCVKPSGTVSQLTDAASGIHARHGPYYIRTVRGDKKDPLTQFMIDMGVPYEDCVMKPDSTVVFSFPQKAPDGAITRNQQTALSQLEAWLTYQRHWCEHKPSITVTVKEPEWMDVGAWVWEHFDEVSGISFLPFSDHSYRQAPYQDCTEEEYTKALAKMPKEIDWSRLSEYEKVDSTTGSQELSCVSGVCEIVDIGR